MAKLKETVASCHRCNDLGLENAVKGAVIKKKNNITSRVADLRFKREELLKVL